jgi:eukaryotic-like serine/threonine-protein kinase
MTEQEKRDLAADIGDEALDFDDDSSRKIFIEEKCGNDASLAQYVREYIDGFKQVLGARDGSLPNQASYSAGRAQSAPLVGADGIIDHRYKLVRQLGLGGMGTVFRAIELATGKAAAIKFIQGAHAGSESARMRFVREARAVASLCHPNIVRVYDIGQIKGALYIVMEYVRGSRLEVVAAQAHISLQTKLSIMAQVCNALAYHMPRALFIAT